MLFKKKNMLFKKLLGTKQVPEVWTWCTRLNICVLNVLHCSNRCSLAHFFFFSLEWEPAKAVLCKIAMKFVVYECLGSKNNVNRGEKLTIFNANGYCFWLSVPFGLPKHFLAVQKSPCSVELIEITWYAQYLKKKKKWIVKAYLRRMCVYCVVFKTEWTKAEIAVCS